MSDPISPIRSERHDFHEEPDDHPTRVRIPVRDPQDLLSLPDVHTDVLARAIRAGSTAPPASTRAVEPTGPRADAAAPAQARLDAFRARAMPSYHTPEGDVRVAAPFRMFGGYPGHEQRIVQPNTGALVVAARKSGLAPDVVDLVREGRGTPEQIQKLTQALIDDGRVPPFDGRTRLDDRVRQMMFDHGIGFDCAGYVRQASLAARGTDNAAAGFASPAKEDLSRLEAHGYRRVGLQEARAGDVIAFEPATPGNGAVGHRAIVYDVRAPTRIELEQLRDSGTVGAAMAAGGRVTVVQVDSSFGCGGSALRGGVRREAWFHDDTGQWMRIGREQIAHPTNTPYVDSDRVEGVYRAPARAAEVQ
ncbi:MAG TPA: hypothetical protein VIF09_05825 [Polyangiaceae bacterium]